MQYQLLPSLTEEEYQALKGDIAQRGVQVPIEFDEKGNVLDGHHRIMACNELGIKDYPSIIRAGMSEDEKIEHILSLNLNRRHLGREQRRELVIKLGMQGWSTRRIAENLHISHMTVNRDISPVTNVTTEFPKRIIGKDGKSYSSVMAKNKREATRTFEALANMPVGILPDKTLDVKRVERLEREYRADEKRKAINITESTIGKARLLLGDFRERGKEIPDASVDMVFTDPPYPEEFLPIWYDLSRFAARILKPEGLLIAYTGALFLPAVIAGLDEYLRFWWSGTIILDGPHSRVHARNVSQGSKPLLFYVRHDYKKSDIWIEDTYQSEGEQKSDHDWQQSLGAAKYFISKLSKPGSLIVDPFLGGGTTGLAALETGRNFIGIEIDPVSFANSEERLAKWMKASGT